MCSFEIKIILVINQFQTMQWLHLWKKDSKKRKREKKNCGWDLKKKFALFIE